MENNKIVKILIVVVSVAVILESLMIISRLNQGKKIAMVLNQNQPTAVQNQVQDVVAKLVMTSSNIEWIRGKPQTIKILLVPQKDIAVDAIDLYMKYDASAVTVNKLDFAQTKPTLNKIKPESGLVVANYLNSEKDGMKLSRNVPVELMTVTATPKRSGATQFEIATGNSSNGSVTMIVENDTSNVLPFSADKLSINVK